MPIWWFDTAAPLEDSFHNGSCFFVKVESNFFGVTAYHVIKGYDKDKNKYRNPQLMIGNNQLPCLDIIEYDDNYDVATFRITQAQADSISMQDVDGNIRSIVPFNYSREQWESLKLLKKDDTVMFTGYPGEFRNFNGNYEVCFTQKSNDGVISCVDAQRKEYRLNITKDNLVSLDDTPTHIYDLGGASGAPVFTFDDRFKDKVSLCGLIGEGAKLFEDASTTIIQGISSINSDGTINRFLN